MNPGTLRIAILVTELLVFLVGTAFAAYFISHASALHIAPGETPPAHFPVVAYDGDRAKPAAGSYRVMAWSEWEKFATGRPDASLLLPERAGAIKSGDAGEAAFTVTEEAGSRQTVELTWRKGGDERVARYVAQARSIEARYLRTLGTQTFLLSVIVGFMAGVVAGKAMRKHWLARPAPFAPPPQGKE